MTSERHPKKVQPAIEIEQKIHFLVSAEVAAHASGVVVAALRANKSQISPSSVVGLMKLALAHVESVPVGEQINAIEDLLRSAVHEIREERQK
ncbi:hypothetical protein LT85_p036 (plasmid) [Collimonas arenae]|uniref:Uncharacterized protein n=1 Tax=Collimonas arenae TaxID=279058 RepID=A0A0A1FKH6_9BURK|nr:hypothetical protein [Collimonas arenae]AIY44215.1 hypothetical protein LT85_p036 [Collimonas arenae]